MGTRVAACKTMKRVALIIGLLMLAAPARADFYYHPDLGVTYKPEQYCEWQDRILPTIYQNICKTMALPVPTKWIDVDHSGYLIDLNSIRSLSPNRFGVDVVATIMHDFGNNKRLNFTLAFSCGNRRYTVWTDPNAPWMEAQENSIMDHVRIQACVSRDVELPG